MKHFFHSSLITRFNVMYFSAFVFRAKETATKKSLCWNSVVGFNRCYRIKQ